jgi:predicted regulator of Ras-like GTPase activity (Roadblock/LC7/MglB family)
MSKMEEILQEVRTELGPDLVATDLVGMDGLSVAGISASVDFDASAAAARLAMMMRMADRVAGKIEVGEVDDSLITTDEYYILTRFLGDGSYYWQMTLGRDATLGMARMVMREYAEELWNAIPR